jgi:hypothetical protein
MNDANKAIVRRMNRHTVILVALLCGVAIGIGVLFARRMHEDISSLKLSWMNDGLKAYSSSDGPFVITHLFHPWSGSRESSVAQLPQPVTVIDSRGHFFTHADIRGLTWVGASGETNSPPSVGTDLKAFYWVPKETDRTSEHDIFRKKELR